MSEFETAKTNNAAQQTQSTINYQQAASKLTKSTSNFDKPPTTPLYPSLSVILPSLLAWQIIEINFAVNLVVVFAFNTLHY